MPQEARRTQDDIELHSVADVLLRIRNELQDVAGLIEKLEPQLEVMNTKEGPSSAERVQIFQGIDLAVQTARGLAHFLDEMTAAMPPDWQVDISTASNLVLLADMQRRLSDAVEHAGENTRDSGSSSGEIELF